MQDVLAIIGIFICPVVMIILIVWFKSNERQKRYQLQAEVYLKALEKGQSVPADWFTDTIKKSNPLNTGIILMAAGIGISLFFWLMSIFLASIDQDASNGLMSVMPLGIIPFFIGVAYVIIHFIGKKKATNENAQ